jgi:hypothetical protein
MWIWIQLMTRGLHPKKKGSSEEEQSTSVRRVMPFDDIDLMLISDSVIVE